MRLTRLHGTVRTGQVYAPPKTGTQSAARWAESRGLDVRFFSHTLDPPEVDMQNRSWDEGLGRPVVFVGHFTVAEVRTRFARAGLRCLEYATLREPRKRFLSQLNDLVTRGGGEVVGEALRLSHPVWAPAARGLMNFNQTVTPAPATNAILT